MQEAENITIISNRKKIVLSASTILYIQMLGRCAEIHVSSGTVYRTRMSLGALADSLGDSFIKIHRGCLVSVRAIHAVSDRIDLNNGETLEYAKRKKSEIIGELHAKQQRLIGVLGENSGPVTEEEYHKYYSCFDRLPFAFTDIEMVFNKDLHAVDWIFRYGNPALAKLEKKPLEQLIGNSFGSLFSNMDPKWLCSYERATLYGEMLEIIDYSPEIDTYLKVICFPTFKGHCGCILFDISETKFARSSNDTENALKFYFEKLTSKRTEADAPEKP